VLTVAKAGAHVARHIFSAELWKGAPLSKQSLASSHHDRGTCTDDVLGSQPICSDAKEKKCRIRAVRAERN
jgi:hypothetical protein